MSLEVAPSLNDRDRRHYEAAYRSGNRVLQASFALDAGIRRLQGYLRHQPEPTTVDLTSAIQAMEQSTRETLTQVHGRGAGSWNEYFRLVSQTALLEQRIFAPFVFADEHSHEARRHLVNGIYGISGAIIGEAIHEFETRYSHFDRTELRGVIQEQTVIGLFNRPERARHLLLTSDTSDDLHRRIDINYWRRLDHAETHERIDMQVKTRLLQDADEASVAPTGGIVITAADFNNDDSDIFPISRLIAKELRLHSTEELTVDERNELDAAQNKLITTIDQKYAALSK